MANLETLELTISANSASAVQNIDNLATHLVALGTAIKTPLQQLTLLNKQLQLLKGFSNVKFPNVGGGRSGKYRQAGSPVSQSEAFRLVNNASDQELLTKKAQGMMSEYMTNATGGMLNQKELAQGALAIKKVTNEIEKAGQSADNVKPKFTALEQTLGQIGRIFKTMLIRTAIRSMIKGFSEAWQNAYQFSKNMGGEFAKNIDKMKGSLKSAAYGIIQAFSPLIGVVTPIINVISGAIKYLCDLISQVLQLLGLSSDLIGQNAEDMENAGNSATKSAKQALASFDELNVINQSSGSSGGNNGGSGGIFSNQITEELAKIQVAVGEAMIAIGLILAFSGHIPLGVGMIAIGAAAIVKTLVNDWGKLTQDTKNEIAEIMLIAAGASLALGLILAFTGHVGLGVGLIALGAANLVAVASISDTLTPELKKTIATIEAVVGGALLAVGAILCFTGAGIPLGLAMMAIGGVSLASAIAPNWGELSGKIKETFGVVVTWLTTKWEEVKTAISNAWDAVKKWWEENVSSKIKGAWESTKTFFKNLWEGDDGKGGIKGMATAAFIATGQWWETNVRSKMEKEGVWGGVKGYFEGLWNTVSTGATNAWNKATIWWETSGIGDNVRTAWKGIESFFGDLWSGVESSINSAWNKFVLWKNEKWSNLQSAWDSIKTNLYNVWVNIQNGVAKAWNTFILWKNERWANIQGAWNTIKVNLYNAWINVQNGVAKAWNTFILWKNERWSKIQSAWTGIKNGFVNNVWTPIKSGVRSAWTEASKWWDRTKTGMVSKIESAWKKVGEWFRKNVTGPIAQAWENLKTSVRGILNFFIRGLNAIGRITIPKIEIKLPAWLGGKTFTIMDAKYIQLWRIPTLATGMFDIPEGQLFIANEAGAEMVGSMDGKTTVANQEQIIEGIRRGVSDGQQEQNALLREQNRLLMGILQKSGNVTIGASSALGRVVNQSLQMYGQMTGV